MVGVVILAVVIALAVGIGIYFSVRGSRGSTGRRSPGHDATAGGTAGGYWVAGSDGSG